MHIINKNIKSVISKNTLNISKEISGNKWATIIRDEIKQSVINRISHGGTQPTICCVLVGERPDSTIYVRNKENACKEVGINAIVHRLPLSVTQLEIIDLIQKFNKDDSIHAILVQLPLPNEINEKDVLSTISSFKDVDALGSPFHIGSLAMRGYVPDFVPCTAQGCIELLKREGIKISGLNAVVLGRSNIVGLPTALLLMQENATVTICHSQTVNLVSHLQSADIIIAAIGKPNFVQKDWVKPGVIIIDVGINRIDDTTRKSGYRLVGDVDFANIVDICGRITPVPGGVGPMTIAMLLQNTFKAAEKQQPVIKI